MKDSDKTKNQLLEELQELKKHVVNLAELKQSLNAAKETYEALIHSIDGIVWECDPYTFKFSFVSEQAERLAGYPVSQWLTEPNFWLNHVHPEDREYAMAYCQQATEKMLNHEFEYRMICAQGQTVWLRDIVTVITENNRPAKLVGVMIDITERKHSEQALKESEARFNSFMQNSPAVAWMKDGEGQYAYINQYFGDTFKITLPEILGKTDSYFLPEETAKQLRDNDLAVLASKKPLEIMETVPTPDGTPHYWLVFKFPFEDSSGKQYVGGMAIDITARKLAEEDLKKAHDELEAKVLERTQELAEVNIFFNLSVDLFCIGRLDGTVIRANPAIEKTLGYSIEELSTHKVLEIVHPDDQQKARQALNQLSIGQNILDTEVRVRCKDGSYKWILFSATPVIDQQIFYAVGRDISLRKKAEEEVRRSEQMQAQILDAVTDMIICKDANSRILYANKAFRDFHGISMDGLQDAATSVSSLRQQSITDDAYVFQTGKTVNIPQESIARKDLKTFLFHTIKSPVVDAEGTVVQTVSVARDITEYRQAEEKIKKLNEDLENRVTELATINRELELLTHKLELSRDHALEASQLKSEFVANISHEIRTPISGVLGMTELLLDTSLNEEQNSFARAIHDSAKSLLTIINDVLDFSKMEAGKIELESIDFSLLSLVESSVELIAPVAWDKKLNLMCYVDPNIPSLLKGDPVRLRQILLNLASNSIKFTERGDVIISASLASQNSSAVNVHFEVSDTGIGITEAARKRLFQPFVQADGSTTRKYGGTGLGLSICKRIVELMGGTIGVESTRGKGSTFWFTTAMPRSGFSSTQGMTFLSSAAADLHELKLLVFSDNKASQHILRQYLNAAGIESHHVLSTKEAFKLLDTNAYDIVIVDCSKTCKEALALAKTIRLHSAASSTKIVLTYAFEGKSRSEMESLEGVSVILTKPIRQAQLIDALARATHRPGLTPPKALTTETTTNKPLRASPEALVLVAEDNPVLQELALLQLRKLGVAAHAVTNGKDVLEAVSHTQYSLVLMDCQMPEMDGFEATLAIRKNETITGQHIPIAAMTAAAMKGDREHCITAGMDDYLSKPVTLEQLETLLQRWLPDRPRLVEDKQVSIDSTNFKPQKSQLIDLHALENLYGQGALAEILHMFIREGRVLLSEVGYVLERQDNKRLSQVAHQLKGLCSVMTCNQMEKLSQDLEQAANQRNWQQASTITQLLAQSLDTIFDTFQDSSNLQD
ncbi:MAG: PAS domain S-box protein [Candidatus Melainabacteria bacterium]|nr:PAS domain S-box protein [Candidatus Melainabacteria bacterium]